jgi:acyl-CoA synthetase (AMP-forming)/AMP-acid ligase II
MNSVGDLSWPLRRATRQHATREAVVDRGRRLTYAELSARVDNAGQGLHRIGVSEGEIIAVLAQNSLEYVECWLGIPAAGFILNPLNFRLAEPELAFILNDSGARLLLADRRFYELACRLADQCEQVKQVISHRSRP